MNTNYFYQDLTVGVLVMLGIFGFMCGEFIFSTTLFCASSLISSINFGFKTLEIWGLAGSLEMDTLLTFQVKFVFLALFIANWNRIINNAHL